jgi:hypothetical protein
VAIASEIDGGHDDHAESITATSKSKEKSGIRKKQTGKQGNEEIVHEIVEISEYEASNLRMREQRAKEWLEIRKNQQQSK